MEAEVARKLDTRCPPAQQAACSAAWLFCGVTPRVVMYIYIYIYIYI